MDNQKVIYYKDELNDEFSKAQIIPRKIDENYKYKKNFIWNGISYLFQNVISMPVKFFYTKIKFRIKIVGKEKFKECKKTGYFLYGNHTQAFADTLIPSLANYPKRNYFIVNPENISMKGMGTLVEMLGAVPIPGDIKASKNFLEYIKELINKNYSITIYPEAHIWPYYTKIRNFKSVSFKYPVKLNKPVYTFVNTYQSYGKNNDRIKIITYIDGPFYPNKNIEPKQAQEELRNKVYEIMSKRSKNSNIEPVKYIKKKEREELKC